MTEEEKKNENLCKQCLGRGEKTKIQPEEKYCSLCKPKVALGIYDGKGGLVRPSMVPL